MFVFLFCLFIFDYVIGIEYDAGVPVIDYQLLISEDAAIWGPEQTKFLFALEKVGFFVLTNHKIPKELMDESWQITKDFFDTELENKNSVPMTDEYMYGYTAAEILSRSETADGHAFKPDNKESFNMMIGSMKSSHESARWPVKPEKMGSVLTNYYREMEKNSCESFARSCESFR